MISFLLPRFLSELVNVDLSHNHIMSITEGAFRNQGSLKHLKLDGNKIGKITNQTFFKLPQMEVVSMRRNEITELPQNLFQHSTNFEIFLAGNWQSICLTRHLHGYLVVCETLCGRKGNSSVMSSRLLSGVFYR